MIEIFAIYLCCKNVGKMLRAKGYAPLGLQILLVVLWFIFEFLGGMIGAIIQALSSGPSEGMSPMIYLFALVGAATSAGTVFLIAHFLKPKPGVDQRTNAFPVEPGGQTLPPTS